MNPSLFKKISKKDPLIKVDAEVEIGDVIAYYRDYEIGVSPYYAFRLVE